MSNQWDPRAEGLDTYHLGEPCSPIRQRAWCVIGRLKNNAKPNLLNYRSYQLVDEAMWIGNAVNINTWRAKKLGLRPVRAFGGGALLRTLKVRRVWTQDGM